MSIAFTDLSVIERNAWQAGNSDLAYLAGSVLDLEAEHADELAERDRDIEAANEERDHAEKELSEMRAKLEQVAYDFGQAMKDAKRIGNRAEFERILSVLEGIA